MREQACREKIHKTAERCKLAPETVAEIDRVTGFVKEHPEISRLTTDAVTPLMAISDPEKQKEAISHVEKSLNRKTPTGGTYKKRLTKPEVEKIVEKVSPSENPKAESGVKSGSFAPAKGSIPVTDRPPQPSLAAQMKAKDDGFFIPTTPDPAKAKSARMEELAVELLSMYSPTFQTMVNEIVRVRNTPTSHYGVKDAFYFGVQALAEKKP